VLFFSSVASFHLFFSLLCRAVSAPMCLTDIKISHSDGFFTAEMFLLYFFKAIEPLMHHQCKHILVILYKNLQAAGFAPSAAAVLQYGVCVFCLCSGTSQGVVCR
jgi:hypothetical protein